MRIASNKAFRAVGEWVLDRLLPPACMVCERSVGRQGQLCGDCFRKMAFISEPFCQRCAVPFANAAQGGRAMICGVCEERPPCWDRARAALRYDDLSKGLILQLKHADRLEIAPVLVSYMARAGKELLSGDPLVVPVPLHRGRLLSRRYNQAALLALRLARDHDLQYAPDILRRARRTPSLGGLNAAQRKQSLAGAFSVSPEKAVFLRGRHILLIDDVLTSGATAAECAGLLRHHGAEKVDVLVAARVPDPRD